MPRPLHPCSPEAIGYLVIQTLSNTPRPPRGALAREPTHISETLPVSMGGGRSRIMRLECTRVNPAQPRLHIQAPPHR